MTAIGKIINSTLDYSAAKAGIDLDLTPLDENFTSVKHVVGSRFDDDIMGNMASYRSTLSGGDGADTLASAGYMTTFDGGRGIDTVSYAWSFDSLYVDLSDGVSMNGDTLVSIENIVGAQGNNTLVGNSGANTLVGATLGDWLDGGEGADILIGDGGSDIYVVDNAHDVVIAELNGGTNDKVIASVSYTLGDNVEHLTLDGSAVLNGTGNALGNAMYGNDAANILSGLEGNDRLRGNGGNDVLIGGDGNDVLTGGRGVDKLGGGEGRDQFKFESLSDSLVKTPDHIVDFTSGVDRIDLRDIDARETAHNNNAFAWIGTADFSGKEGELRYETVGADTIVTSDCNGDGVADFAIMLDDFTSSLRSQDFLF